MNGELYNNQIREEFLKDPQPPVFEDFTQEQQEKLLSLMYSNFYQKPLTVKIEGDKYKVYEK